LNHVRSSKIVGIPRVARHSKRAKTREAVHALSVFAASARRLSIGRIFSSGL
jgi:hypothetical protein